jgi:pimeloyl-ACP methyl ester carboxylesterase
MAPARKNRSPKRSPGPRFVFSVLLFSLTCAIGPRLFAAAGPESINFDGPGTSIDQLVLSLKADASSPNTAAAPPVGQGRAVKPIVVAVSGLDMQDIEFCGLKFKDLINIWKKLFPGRPPTAKELHQAFQEFREAMPQFKLKGVLRVDNYLELALQDSAKRNGLDLDIVNFPWSRDPKDTDKVADDFAQKLLVLRDSPETSGQPLFIVAHSWGTILIHEALVRLDKKKQTVLVERLVTLGSPLVPQREWVWIYVKMCDIGDHIHSGAAKPRGVRRWENLWAGLDPFSNAIAAADLNIRVDQPAASYQKRLQDLLKTIQRKLAKKDLDTLQNAGSWHFSYLYGFQAKLESLHEDVSWDIPQKEVADILPAPTEPKPGF